jgi:proteic killer suppression protein
LILNFKHRGLRRLYERDDPRGIPQEHVGKLQNILARLEASENPEDMNLPGFRLHPLKGNRSGLWAVTVRANWRVTFRFEGLDVADVNYEDYH